MDIIASLVAGLLFGAGLTVAQMTNPAKVIDFLDIAAVRTGTWDPTLLMVFCGALPTMFAAYVIQRRMRRPILAASFLVPGRSPVDVHLVTGSAIFGIGWGFAGVCPGPALTALATAGAQLDKLALFIAAMLAGIWLSRFTLPRHSTSASAPA